MNDQIRSSKTFIILLFLLIIAACSRIIPPTPEENSILDGPVGGLTNEENKIFLAGDIAFNDEVFTEETGLGPRFVANSCAACHAGDGKGHPFTSLIRFGQTEPLQTPDEKTGAPQLQNRALPGYEPESLPDGVPHMKLIAPAVTGLGFLAALTDLQILENEDPLDTNMDGISGVASRPNPADYFVQQSIHNSGGKAVGRFGKKAGAIDLLQQIATAYNQDMGVTSIYEPRDPSTGLLHSPEVDESTINDILFYIRTLKAPIPRNTENPDFIAGQQLFVSINCSACHTPSWTTPESDIAALSNKIFHPYTDLLLHDMGPELDDGATEGSAQTYEWRTPGLWGLGLSKNSQGGQHYLMHDGRAKSIEEAILMHGGEASNSKQAYTNLTNAEQAQILFFLESL
ncbi:thiol oxidoreductase [bacterium]|nr:thiol oxidoreductase [bacterium]